MTSILTNRSALAALSTLRSIDKSMEEVQQRVSSGYRVGNAEDNAAYWSIATTMRSDSSALSSVEDALGLAAAKTDTSYAGLQNTITVLTTIKSKLTTASEPGVDKDKVNKELIELKNQLKTFAQSASFSGENWLYNESTTAIGVKRMVGSFTRDAKGGISVQTVNFDAATSVLVDTSSASRGLLTKSITVTYNNTTNTGSYYLLNVSATTGATGTEIALSSATSETDLDGMRLAVESMLKSVIDSAATLGAVKNRVEQQSAFVKDMVSVIDKGVGLLVDADMNEESTRLKALQTQQQLGIQSLSIANANAQNLMSLFRS